MVAIIVNNRDSINLGLNLESAVGTPEEFQSFLNLRLIKVKLAPYRNSGERILNVVTAWYFEFKTPQ